MISVNLAAMLLALQTPTSAEEAAAIVHFNCLANKAKEMDDGISDAATIGAVIAPSCHVELQNWASVVSRHDNKRVKVMILERWKANATNFATRVVLDVRKSRK